MDEEILVGSKPVMSYVLAAITLLNSGHNKIIIKARGAKISRAVDVALTLKNRFIKDAKMSIEASTEQLPSKTNPQQMRNVSVITISLEK